jgi:hypothetical protein
MKKKIVALPGHQFRSSEPQAMTTDWVVVTKTSANEKMSKCHVGSISTWLHVTIMCDYKSQRCPRCNCLEELLSDANLKVE